MSCLICLEEISTIERIVLKLPCNHIFCRKCLKTYAVDQLAMKTKCKCPEPDCKYVIRFEIPILGRRGPVKDDEEWKDQFKSVVSRKVLRKANTARRFDLCPVARCKGTVINGQCDKCRSEICYDCGEIRERDHQCDPEIRANRQEILTKTKLCPNCHVPIIKNQGCDHMTCTQCQFHFSWNTAFPLIQFNPLNQQRTVPNIVHPVPQPVAFSGRGHRFNERPRPNEHAERPATAFDGRGHRLGVEPIPRDGQGHQLGGQPKPRDDHPLLKKIAPQ